MSLKSVLALFLFLTVSLAEANPVLDNIAAGEVKIQQAPSNTTIEQSSAKAIINWQSFNIGENEKTHFQQPAGGVTLNRINPAQGVSQIYGSLSATGKIILLNGAGIYFGPHAMVNVGGLIASSGAGISDQNFLNGKFHFDEVSPYNGSVINEGTIKAEEHGLVALIGNSVSNTGLIEARLGQVTLASANQYILSFQNDNNLDGLMFFAVQTPGNQKGTIINNTGTVIADGGVVYLTYGSASKLLDNTINLEGVIQANAVSDQGGMIMIGEQVDDLNDGHPTINLNGQLSAKGSDEDFSAGGVDIYSLGEVNLSGEINAESPSKGGSVHLLGNDVFIKESGRINVDGEQYEGWPGAGGDIGIQGIHSLQIAEGASLTANGLLKGNGGWIYLQGNHVNLKGKLSAHGGSLQGNGGEIAIAGSKEVAVDKNKIDVSSPTGEQGKWKEFLNDELIDHS